MLWFLGEKERNPLFVSFAAQCPQQSHFNINRLAIMLNPENMFSLQKRLHMWERTLEWVRCCLFSPVPTACFFLYKTTMSMHHASLELDSLVSAWHPLLVILWYLHNISELWHLASVFLNEFNEFLRLAPARWLPLVGQAPNHIGPPQNSLKDIIVHLLALVNLLAYALV